MSARVSRPAPTVVVPRPPFSGAASAIVMAGSVILLARPFVGLGADPRTTLFAASYAAIALASISLPVGTAATKERRSNGSVLLASCVGVVAVAGVYLTGAPIPMPTSTLALPLSVIAAVAEEALLRRVAYARLERFGPVIAIAVTAALFAIVHLPAYGIAALPVDLGAGVLFGWQRWAAGTWTVPATTHALANILATLR